MDPWFVALIAALPSVVLASIVMKQRLQIVALEKCVTSLRSADEKREDERSTLLKKNHQADGMIALLQGENSQLRTEVSRLVAELSRSRNESSSLREENSLLHGEAVRLQTELLVLRSHIAELVMERTGLQQQKIDLDDTVSTLEKKVWAANEEVAQTKKQREFQIKRLESAVQLLDFLSKAAKMVGVARFFQ
jgi:chromosome segregation ATPase